MPDVSYVIRIVGGGGGVGKGKEKEKEKNVTGLGSEILNSAKNYGMGIVNKFAGVGTKASYLAPVAIAATALNELDNIRISKVGITTGNYTYQEYQESVKSEVLSIVSNPLSIFSKIVTQWKTRELTRAKMEVERISTREFNIRAGSLGNRAPRNQ